MTKSVTLGLIGDQLKGLGKDFGKTAIAQINPLEQVGEKKIEGDPTASKNGQSTDTKDVVKALYGIGQKEPKQGDQKLSKETEKMLKGKTAQEQQELLKRRAELHKLYVDDLNKRQQQEERPAEKVEREKMQELQEEQKKESKKPKPLAVDQAQNIEKNRGSSG